MGYAGFSLEKFSRAFLPAATAKIGRMALEVMRMRRIIHQASLA
jgi:hypothetical protein